MALVHIQVGLWRGLWRAEMGLSGKTQPRGRCPGGRTPRSPGRDEEALAAPRAVRHGRCLGLSAQLGRGRRRPLSMASAVAWPVLWQLRGPHTGMFQGHDLEGEA